MHGHWRIGIARPAQELAVPQENANRIFDLWLEAEERSCAAVVFPELAVSGYTCGDLFQQDVTLDQCDAAIESLVDKTKNFSCTGLVGAPVRVSGRLFNCVVVIRAGQIRGVVPKSYLPNYQEFYERRWFASGLGVRNQSIEYGGVSTPFGSDLLFKFDGGFNFGVEICEDLWAPSAPSEALCSAGADIIFNASASNEIVGKSAYRRQLVRDRSSRSLAAYAYVSSGVGESTSDLVFSGDGIIYELGTELASLQRFKEEAEFKFADIDVQKLRYLRRTESTIKDTTWQNFRTINLAEAADFSDWQRQLEPLPFVPKDSVQVEERCNEIMAIQSAGLRRRLRHTRASKAVVGVSGGLDSTLALLVAKRAVSEIEDCDVLGITMPGPGTSDRTKANAIQLCEALQIECREIEITKSVEQHLEDIGHDGETTNIAYENAQARERTQILMDVANQERGIVIGTGDLSEIALGWSTYNGDHMSMYSVNCTVPKTLVRHLVGWAASQQSAELRATLLDIVDTPVSPELIPSSDSGQIDQLTEEVIGPYEVHDFFLYQLLRCGADPMRLLFLSKQAFQNKYSSDELEKWRDLFVKRFFNNQFKRNCSPDGPKVGTVALSPRGDWRMPADANWQGWIK